MIRPDTFDFLSELAVNNERDWFQRHKARHDSARENILDFASRLIPKMAKSDPDISADLDVRRCVLRIYRDVRFSKNKAPYKDHVGIGISGKDPSGPGYYLHINPQESFLAGGSWLPGPDILKAIRQEIDYNAQDFLEIVEAPPFRNYFGEPDQEYKLKTTPKGYPADHPQIEYLKLKSFTFTHILDRKDLSSVGAVDTVAAGFAKLYPFMAFLRNALS